MARETLRPGQQCRANDEQLSYIALPLELQHRIDAYLCMLFYVYASICMAARYIHPRTPLQLITLAHEDRYRNAVPPSCVPGFHSAFFGAPHACGLLDTLFKCASQRDVAYAYNNASLATATHYAALHPTAAGYAPTIGNIPIDMCYAVDYSDNRLSNEYLANVPRGMLQFVMPLIAGIIREMPMLDNRLLTAVLAADMHDVACEQYQLSPMAKKIVAAAAYYILEAARTTTQPAIVQQVAQQQLARIVEYYRRQSSSTIPARSRGVIVRILIGYAELYAVAPHGTPTRFGYDISRSFVNADECINCIVTMPIETSLTAEPFDKVCYCIGNGASDMAILGIPVDLWLPDWTRFAVPTATAHAIRLAHREWLTDMAQQHNMNYSALAHLIAMPTPGDGMHTDNTSSTPDELTEQQNSAQTIVCGGRPPRNVQIRSNVNE